MMEKTKTNIHVCQICGRSNKKVELFPAELVRNNVVQIIKSDFPEWSETGYICKLHADRRNG